MSGMDNPQDPVGQEIGRLVDQALNILARYGNDLDPVRAERARRFAAAVLEDRPEQPLEDS